MIDSNLLISLGITFICVNITIHIFIACIFNIIDNFNAIYSIIAIIAIIAAILLVFIGVIAICRLSIVSAFVVVVIIIVVVKVVIVVIVAIIAAIVVKVIISRQAVAIAGINFTHFFSLSFLAFIIPLMMDVL